jgi:hypothetical protein
VTRLTAKSVPITSENTSVSAAATSVATRAWPSSSQTARKLESNGLISGPHSSPENCPWLASRMTTRAITTSTITPATLLEIRVRRRATGPGAS